MDDTVSAAAGDDYSFAVRADGDLLSWGRSKACLSAEDDDKTLKDFITSPLKIMDNTERIYISRYVRKREFIVKKDGSLWTWCD